jgi:hypothetical protein
LKTKSVKFWLVGIVIVILLSMILAFNWPFHENVTYSFPLDKASAQLIAREKVKSEFMGAKLIRSSDSVESKVELTGWIFIFESKWIFGWNDHSAAIMVDIITGETVVQRAH